MVLLGGHPAKYWPLIAVHMCVRVRVRARVFIILSPTFPANLIVKRSHPST